MPEQPPENSNDQQNRRNNQIIPIIREVTSDEFYQIILSIIDSLTHIMILENEPLPGEIIRVNENKALFFFDDTDLEHETPFGSDSDEYKVAIKCNETRWILALWYSILLRNIYNNRAENGTLDRSHRDVLLPQRTSLDMLKKQLYNFIKDRNIDVPIDDVIDFGPDYYHKAQERLFYMSNVLCTINDNDQTINIENREIPLNDIDIWTPEEILHQYGIVM